MACRQFFFNQLPLACSFSYLLSYRQYQSQINSKVLQHSYCCEFSLFLTINNHCGIKSNEMKWKKTLFCWMEFHGVWWSSELIGQRKPTKQANQINFIKSINWFVNWLVPLLVLWLPLRGSLALQLNQNQIKNNFWFSFAFTSGSLTHRPSIKIKDF